MNSRRTLLSALTRIAIVLALPRGATAQTKTLASGPTSGPTANPAVDWVATARDAIARLRPQLTPQTAGARPPAMTSAPADEGGAHRGVLSTPGLIPARGASGLRWLPFNLDPASAIVGDVEDGARDAGHSVSIETSTVGNGKVIRIQPRRRLFGRALPFGAQALVIAYAPDGRVALAACELPADPAALETARRDLERERAAGGMSAWVAASGSAGLSAFALNRPDEVALLMQGAAGAAVMYLHLGRFDRYLVAAPL